MTIAIFGNATKQLTLNEVLHILEFMGKHRVNVLLSQELRKELNLRDYPAFPETWVGNEQPNNPYNEPIDFALSVGGDGTFLTTAAAIGNKAIPILGINCGNLGFLADVQSSDVDRIMQQLVDQRYTIEQRSLLSLTGPREGLILAPNALNEIAILKQGMSSMISIEVKANGHLLHTYHADGLVFSTPTGSTAYNLSIGGPILVPQTRGIVLSPIAPHSLTARPMVVPDDWQFDLRIQSRNSDYMVSIDGRSQILSTDNPLHIECSPYRIKVVQIEENSFLQSLREKLNWGR